MKGWKKVISAVVVLAVAVVAAGVAIIKSLDFNEYRGLIADQVKAATGREMTIAGRLDVKVSLTPALAVEGVTFANAAWGSRRQMATLKQLAAEVELLPLLTGDVRVKRLVLTGLDVFLETDAKGLGNWELLPAGKAEPAKPATDTAAKLPVVHAVGMKDIAVSFRDGKTGKTTALRLARLDVEEKGMDAPMTVALAGDFDGKAFEASGLLGPLAALIKGGVPYPVSLRAKALGAEVEIEGVVSEPRAMTGLDLKVQASGKELAETVTAVAAQAAVEKLRKLPAIGPFRVAARIKGDAAKFSLSAIDVAVGKDEQARLTLSGAVADVPTAAGVDVKFTLEAKDAGPLARAFGVEPPALPPFKVAAALSNPKDGYVLDGFDAKLANSDLRGRLRLQLAGLPRPRLDGEFDADLLDLDALLPKRPAATAPAKKSDRVFPADPLPVDGLKAADGRLRLKAKRAIAGGIAVDDIELGLVLAGGRLEIKPIAAAVGGGKVAGAAVVDGARPTPAVTITMTARQVDYGAVLQQLQVTDIARGKLDATIDLRGQGGSLRTIMAGLNGRARVVTEGGQIDSGLLNVLSADVTSALPFFDSKGDKSIRCGVVDLDVRNGRATTKALVFETGGLSMIGSGGVNLADESIAIKIDPRAKKLSLLKLTLVPVNVGGTLANPTALPDVGGAAVGAVTGAVKTATDIATGVAEGGVKALGGLVGIGGDNKTSGPAQSVDDTDYCKLALAGQSLTPATAKPAPTSTTPPAAQPQQKPGSTADHLDKKLDELGKGIGGALKGLFGK